MSVFTVLIAGNDNRNQRMKKGKSAQIGRANNAKHPNTGNASSAASTPDKYKPVPAAALSVSVRETPRSLTDRDTFATHAFEHAAPADISSPVSAGHTRRVKLLVDMGSGRIAMTGQLDDEELSSLQGALRDNEEVEMVEDMEGLEEGVGVVSMTRSMLLSDSDEVRRTD